MKNNTLQHQNANTLIQWFYHCCLNVNVNVNLYSALSQSVSNAPNAPHTAETSVSSIGDWSCWRWWVLDHAGRWSVRSRLSDQSRQTHNGCTYHDHETIRKNRGVI